VRLCSVEVIYAVRACDLNYIGGIYPHLRNNMGVGASVLATFSSVAEKI
jgi:hypothetical protein